VTTGTAGTGTVPLPWPAPRARTPVRAVVPLPGSKSVTNRALVLGALADGPSVLRSPLRSRDTLLMATALEQLGCRVDSDGDDWRVVPGPLTGGVEVECGLAGTVMRFVPPLAALAAAPVRFDGDPAARRRPMGAMLAALRGLGAQVDDGGRGSLPFTVRGRGGSARPGPGLRGGPVTLDASASSQFVSGLLLSGARYDEGVTVRHAGAPLPSLPHVAMTVAMLRGCGVSVDDAGPDTWAVRPGPVSGLDLVVEPDLSNAAPFLVAALVTGGTVTVPRWPAGTTQAGAALPELLTRMGASVTLDGRGLTVTGGGAVVGLEADLRHVGELTPVLAAACALATTPSHLYGIAHLRGHETDRLAALATGLTALGGDVTETDDGLRIRPRPLHGGLFATYDDHRLATAGAVLGLVVDGIDVEDVATTGKTLPGFPDRWLAMLRGSGPDG